MAYTANIVEVMIASPGDVAAERQLIRDLIAEWNVVHARSRHTVLLPRGWDTHATPTFGKEPQEVINEEVLKAADLLVGVFWARLGTATTRHVSGTVEEIERHVAAGKPAMLYFSNAPLPPDRLDQEQYAALSLFRKSCEDRALYETYQDLAEFRTKFARQLALKVATAFPAPVSALPAAAAKGSFDAATISMLSEQARVILAEAAKTATGQINRFDLDQALVIQVNGKSFEARLDNGRFRAELESALDELLENDLASDVVGKRTLLQLTSKGYRIASKLPDAA